MAKKKDNTDFIQEEVVEETVELEVVETPEPVIEKTTPKKVDVEAFKARKLRGINMMPNERRRKLHAEWLLRNK